MKGKHLTQHHLDSDDTASSICLMIPFKIQILTSMSVHPVTCGYIDKPWLFCRGVGSGLNKSTETPKPGVFDPCFTRRCRVRCYSHWRSLCVLHKLAEIATVHLKSLIMVPGPSPSHFCSHTGLIWDIQWRIAFSLNKPSGSLLGFPGGGPPSRLTWEDF